MFYTGGLPFHLAKYLYYVKSYTFAANNPKGGPIPLGYNALRTSLLDEAQVHIQELLQSIEGTWKDKGVAIVSNWWSCLAKEVTYQLYSHAKGGPIFLKVVNVEGIQKNKDLISVLMEKVIQEVGPKNVIQVIMIMLGYVWHRAWTLKVNFHTYFRPHVLSILWILHWGIFVSQRYSGQFGDLWRMSLDHESLWRCKLL